jgi:hypothetical protein
MLVLIWDSVFVRGRRFRRASSVKNEDVFSAYDVGLGSESRSHPI